MAKETNEDIKRLNLRMGNEIHDWYEMQARRMGVPTSSYMIMTLAQHMQAIEGLATAREWNPDVLRKIAEYKSAQGDASEAVLDREGRSLVG